MCNRFFILLYKYNNMEPSALTVYKSPFTKVRLGRDFDGGYIIADIPNANYNLLLAGGIEYDISFEDAFIKKYPDVKCLAFDGTINGLPKENEKITFIKKNIGSENTDQYTNLHDIIDAYDNIFVKMDIEGGEVPWINSLSDEQMNKFEQITIEFHSPFSDVEMNMFNKINQNHYLIHFHGNNCCGLRNHKGINIPNIFECTYLHKKYFTGVPELNSDLIPSALDMKNTENYEIYINYPPFVHNAITMSGKCDFTIVYKTYKNDLKWLEFSLLSLKKFLDVSSIFEIIIYTHDVVFSEVCQLIDKIQFISCRIIPVHYNYHGYIKQQEVKANCYKDVRTKYVILLDSDLILQKPLNMKKLLRDDGKIEWKYLNKHDDPKHEVFTVWKKACEDSTRTPKTVHYMSNGWPFIFTRQSLEAAADKFKEMHSCDYEAYCHNRCGHEGIKVEDSTTAIFDRLSRVFTEFEYLGWYCHNFSNDYVFTPTKYCRMMASFQKENPASYFIQNWSHGGLNKEITKNINKIIQNKKTIIMVWTQQVKNLVTDDTNNFFGLGDILRGTMSMFQLSKKYDFQLIVDIQLHPVSKYLHIKGNEYSNYVLQNANNIPFIYPEDIEQFIKNNDEDVCCLLTNSHLIDEVTQECKDFIKNILTPNDEFAKYINDLKIAKNTPANYNILHFRLGDTLLVRKSSNVDFQNYINIMNQHKESNDILMSDSTRFKEQVMIGNYGVFLFHIHVAHLGYAQHTNDIKDTLFEFFVITQSSKIKTFSNYGHISGFVYLAHLVYDIPLVRIQ